MKNTSLPLLARLPITVCIVGSRKLNQNENFITYPWSLLAPHLRVYGLDADPRACELANACVEMLGVDWQEKHFPVAVSNVNGKRTFYQTANPNCSSVLPPNPSFVDRFSSMKEGFQVVNTFMVDVITLDSFCAQESISHIDFLQTDVQGSDLDVLKGAVSQLENSIIGLMIEVLFAPLYLEQPVFSEIDKLLQVYGFQLFDLEALDAWCRLPRHSFPVRTQRKGQFLWADAYYFKDPLLRTHALNNNPQSVMSSEQAFKLACLADLLGFSDFSLELLEYLTVSYGKDNPDYNFSDLIIDAITEMFPKRFSSFDVISRMKDYL